MESHINIPGEIVEWLSLSVNGTPNWGAGKNGLVHWFSMLYKDTKNNRHMDGFKQLNLDNIRDKFYSSNRGDLYDPLIRYFRSWGQVNNINGGSYISEESFLNLEEKFKAFIHKSDEGPQPEPEVHMDEDSCSDMFENDDAKFITYVDRIRLLLSETYTEERHDELRGMLIEIQQELKKCSEVLGSAVVASKIGKFNSLNKKVKTWAAASKAKTKAKTKAKPTAKSTAKTKAKTKATPKAETKKKPSDRWVCRTGTCVPNKYGNFSTREDCQKTCTYETTTDKTLPPQFFRPDGERLSARELFNSFGVTKPKPTNVDVIKILRKLYPGLSFQEELKNKEAYKELQKAKDALDPNVFTEDPTWQKAGIKRKSKSKTKKRKNIKRKSKTSKKNKKTRRAKRTRRR